METGKKILLNHLGQISYIFVYEKLKEANPCKKKFEVENAIKFQSEHEDHCEAIIVTCYEMELFSEGRRGSDWMSMWYDFFWETSCKKCQEEIKKEEFWGNFDESFRRNSIESRIEKEENERLKQFEEDFLRGKIK